MIEHSRRHKPTLIVTRPGQPLAAAQKFAFALPTLNIFQHRVKLALVHRRSHVRPRLQPIAHDILPGAGRQHLDELVRDALLNHHAARRRTALPRRSKRAREHRLHRQLQIRVRQHHHWILAAHLALNFLQVRRARSVQRATYLIRSGKREPVHVRILHQLIAGFAPRTHHQVQHARRQSRLFENLHGLHCRQRRQRRRLEHHRIPAHQCRRDFPYRNRHGKIPRSDRAHHSQRLAYRERKILGQFACQRSAFYPPRLARHEFQNIDSPLHFAQRILQRLTFLARQQPRQRFLLFLHHPRRRKKYLAAIRRWHLPPGRKGRLGRHDSFFHFLPRRKRYARHHLLRVSGVPPLHNLGGLRLHPLSINVIPTKLIRRYRRGHYTLRPNLAKQTRWIALGVFVLNSNRWRRIQKVKITTHEPPVNTVQKGSFVREWCNSLKISTPRTLTSKTKAHRNIFPVGLTLVARPCSPVSNTPLRGAARQASVHLAAEGSPINFQITKT